MSDLSNIDRRKALKKASLLLGFSISGPALIGVLNGCAAQDGIDWQPLFLTEHEASMVEAASARILPSGKTPGAADAMVGRFIDQMAAEYYLPEDQQHFRKGLEDLEHLSREVANKAFEKATEEEQDQVLTQMALKAMEQTQTPGQRHFFLMLKELTILGFFTSEVGAAQFLNFDEIPGGYQGCQSLESVGGKTWST